MFEETARLYELRIEFRITAELIGRQQSESKNLET